MVDEVILFYRGIQIYIDYDGTLHDSDVLIFYGGILDRGADYGVCRSRPSNFSIRTFGLVFHISVV